jgi:hypothetical protein
MKLIYNDGYTKCVRGKDGLYHSRIRSLVIFEAALIFASSECDILTTLRAFIIQGLCKCEEMMMFIFVM